MKECGRQIYKPCHKDFGIFHQVGPCHGMALRATRNGIVGTRHGVSPPEGLSLLQEIPPPQGLFQLQGLPPNQGMHPSERVFPIPCISNSQGISVPNCMQPNYKFLMKNTGMKSNRSRFAMIAMGLLCVALLFMMFPGDLSAQDFLPRFDRFRVIQTDTTHINFREIWLKSKDVNKDNAPGFTKRAFEKIEKGFFAEALADLERSVKLDSMIAGNYTLLGFLKFKQDSITQAMMYFKKALSINSSDPANYFCLGDVYMKLNKLEAADSCYKICTTLDGEYYQAYFKRANMAFAGNDIKTAETLYRKVIEVNPGYGMAYFNLALVFLYTNPDKTIRYLNKAVAHDPGFAGAWFFRGYLNLLMNGSKRAALDDWGRAIELEPANVTYHMFRGFFNIHMEKYQEGVNEIVHTLNARGYHAGISDNSRHRPLCWFFDEST